MNCKEFSDNLEPYLDDTIEEDLRVPLPAPSAGVSLLQGAGACA